MDVHRARRKVLDHDSLVRPIVLVGPVDAAGVPVGPVDELAKHGHGKWIDGRADDDLTIGSRERRSLNLLPKGN